MSETKKKAKEPFSKTGQPRFGAVLTVVLPDGTKDRAEVIAKGWGAGGYATLAEVLVVWEDGEREWVPWDDLQPRIISATMEPDDLIPLSQRNA